MKIAACKGRSSKVLFTGLVGLDFRTLFPDILVKVILKQQQQQQFKLDLILLGCRLQAQEKRYGVREASFSRSRCREASLVLIRQQKGHLRP